MAKTEITHTPDFRTVNGRQRWTYKHGQRTARIYHVKHGKYVINTYIGNRLCGVVKATNQQQAKKIARDFVQK